MPFYYGDYYPLTKNIRDNSVWIAWQFDRPEQGDGVVQAFRRNTSVYETGRAEARGLDLNCMYEVIDLDRGQPRQFSGKELLEKGLPVTISNQPGAVAITYRKKS